MASEHATTKSDQPALMLFVAGDSPRSTRAHERLARALEARGYDTDNVEIVDALREPARILEYRVFATPTLTARPPTASALYGDLSDTEALARFLDGILEPG